MGEFFEFEEQDAKLLLTAIKKDDEKAFSRLTASDRYLSFSFGKFPVLSLCYLYSSTKILLKHEKRMLSVSDVTFVEEDFETQAKFKKIAGRSIRLFDEVVSPFSMLAVLHKNTKLKLYIKKEIVPQKDLQLIPKIYSLSHTQHAQIQSNRLKLKALPMPKGKICFITITSIVCAVIIALSGVMINYSLSVPNGSENSPFVITSSSAFEQAIAKSGAHVSLSADVSIDKQIDNFDGTIIGNGHTITIKDGAFINTFSGKISDVIIAADNKHISADTDKSLFINRNDGEISNVTFSAHEFVIDIPTQEIHEGETVYRYVSPFVAVNANVINHCTVDFDGTVNGIDHVNTTIGAICGQNGGTVTNCTANGNLSTTLADIGGIVGENTNVGVIDNCFNNANLSQNSPSNDWSPNVGGIVCINNGNLANCQNFGALSATSTSTETTLIYIGGIACQNNYGISYCKNNGTITCNGATSRLYIGGIAANQESAGGIVNSANCGNILSISSADDFVFAGGIVGVNNGGAVKGNFVLSTISTQGSCTKQFAGGIIGTCDYTSFYNSASYAPYYQIFSSLVLCYANAYLKSATTPFGVALVAVSPTELYQTSNEFCIETYSTVPFENADDIKNTEIYWE